MRVILYQTSKKNNSTLIPQGGVTLDGVTLKTATSTLTPTLLLSTEHNFFSEPVTAVNIDGKYYFVTNIRSVKQNLWELSCEIDVLATYKEEIVENTCLIEFDESVNVNIADTRLPVIKNVDRAGTIVSMREIMREGGTFLLGVNGQGSVTTFAFNNMDTITNITDSIGDWADNLFNGVELSVDGICDAVVRGFKQFATAGSANSNIRSCIWIPWAINTVAVKPVIVGNYNTGYTGYTVTARCAVHNFTIKIPWKFGDWRDSNPYTTVYLYIPYVGFLSYSADELHGVNSLTIQFSIDQITGAVSAVVKAGEYIIGAYGGSSAISIPIGISNITPQQVVGSIVSGVAATAVGGIWGFNAGTLNALASFVNPLQTTVGSFGNGSGALQPESIACYVYTHDIPDTPTSYGSVIGTPTYKVKKLSDLSGYVKTGNASVSVEGATYSEIAKINNLLNGGVYIE